MKSFSTKAGLLGSMILVLSNVTNRAERQVLAWGQNYYGQTNLPAGLTDVVMVASGGAHSLALNRNGTVVAWGNNSVGQTNVPPGLLNVVSITGGFPFSVALKSDGTMVGWGQYQPGQTNLQAGLTNAVALAGGLAHAAALKADGTVIAWGRNQEGQTSVPPGLSNIVGIGTGAYHTMALTADGRVIAWGDPWFVKVPPDLTNAVAVVGATLAASLALRADTTVTSWGPLQPNFPAGLSNVVALGAGKGEDLALLADGTVVGAGWSGSLPLPVGLTNVVAVAAGDAHAIALIGDGSPFLTSALVDRTIPAGRTAWIYASATGAWPLQYQWSLSGTNLPGATHAILTLDNVTPAQAGRYSVTVSNAFATVTSPEFHVNVAPVLITAQPTDQLAVLGGSAALTVSTIGPAALRYQWQFNGAEIPDATDHVLRLTNLQFDETGEYSVVVTSEFGSVSSASAHLEVSQVAAWVAVHRLYTFLAAKRISL
jgi:alpha-tubulin suppressor-like RCC1 family protein